MRCIAHVFGGNAITRLAAAAVLSLFSFLHGTCSDNSLRRGNWCREKGDECPVYEIGLAYFRTFFNIKSETLRQKKYGHRLAKKWNIHVWL